MSEPVLLSKDIESLNERIKEYEVRMGKIVKRANHCTIPTKRCAPWPREFPTKPGLKEVNR